MSVQEPEYIVIRSRAQLVYCPLCGTETELTSREYSSEIVCPNHGELLLD